MTPRGWPIIRVAGETSAGYFPDRFSLLPAFLAIVLAILSGRVIPSLFLGCLSGALLATRFDPLAGVSHLAVDVAWTRILGDSFYREIIGFVVFWSGRKAFTTLMTTLGGGG